MAAPRRSLFIWKKLIDHRVSPSMIELYLQRRCMSEG